MIYLDNAATTFPKPECVYKALDNANRHMAFNAGRGSYKEAKDVSDMIQDTRTKIAAFVGLGPEVVSFESSATEAMNIIINGLDLKEGDNVYISPFEHNAVVRPLYNLQSKKGINIRLLPFDKETWEIETQKMNDLFSLYKPKACIITHISNVTGYILPVGSIFEQTKTYNCINVLDSSQSYGIVNPSTKDVDFIVFAGHKSLYASFGIAGFLNVNGTLLQISKSGGTGSDSLNSVAIAGLNKSIDWLKENDVYNHEKELTDYLIKELHQIKNVHIYVSEMGSVLGIISFNVDGYFAEEIGSILYDEYGICVRTGYHCCPFIHEFIDSKSKKGTVRVSAGAFNSKNDIDLLIDALKTL